MKLNIGIAFEATLVITLSMLWCEVGYYYFVLYFNCNNWPGLSEQKSQQSGQSLIKLLVITDTHIMGPVKSVWIDKVLREWHMKQAFRISNSYFKPDVLVFLGDLLDEGSFSRDQYFNQACKDFDEIFAYDDTTQERIIIPGNHDVGFHDQMRDFPFLLGRFGNRYPTTSSIELIRTPKTKHLNLIASNSMSFYNDTCPFCSFSMASLKQLESYLNRERDLNRYIAPILLGHIPLFRLNDLNCTYPSFLRTRVSKNNIEGEDVMHRISSDTILSKLKPRLALSGHTHMYCHTEHNAPGGERDSIRELTVTSYNHKYAELTPGFLLMTANSTHVFTRHCNLVEEWVIVSVYVATLIVVILRLIFALKNKNMSLNLLGENKTQLST